MEIHKEVWDCHPGWLDYVRQTWKPGLGRVQQQKDESPERLAFLNAARRSFEGLLFPVKQVKTWVSVQQPSQGEGYCDEYPHVHYPLDGLTLVHYLDPGDQPAPLHILDGDNVIEEIVPYVGLTVFMPNDVLHGVLHNLGTTDRVQMIATALRR